MRVINFSNFTERQTYNGEPYFVSEYGDKCLMNDRLGTGRPQ